MSRTSKRVLGRQARHRRIRKHVAGAGDRPRLCVFRSNKHLYAQIVDDLAGKTLFGCSTLDERLKSAAGATVSAAEALGKLMATEAVKRGIKQVVFDRGGYGFHGRVKAFADAARSGGLQV